MSTLSLIALIGLLGTIIWSDLRLMRIPHVLLGLIALLFLVAVAPTLPMSELLWRLVAGILVFGACFAAFAARLLGGGDTKLLPLLVLFVPTEALALFALFLSAGLILGLVVVRGLRRLPRSSVQRWAGLDRRDRYPLGPGIAVAGIGFFTLGPSLAAFL